ncbi:MAG: DUF2165 family protein [Gammaproteobacteria bacterium]|nr:DUF2165 family protein [Gammaproteobacteria bacterium]
MLRTLKILLVLFIGLHALIYGLQNLVNLSEAHQVLGYVLSNQGHEYYPSTMFFAVTSPLLHWCALWLVIVGELAVGYFGIKGAWDMFSVRKDAAEQFHAAKTNGVIAAALALLVWFGFFMTFGAAFFQMWQTELGAGSMEGAFMYSMASAITMIFVYTTHD